MPRVFPLVFVTAVFEGGFCSGKKMPDHVGVVRPFSMAKISSSLSRISGKSMSKAGRPASVLTGFVNDHTYVVQENWLQ